MTKKFKLFCFGFGQVAQYFIKNLVSKKYKFDFVATTTSKTSLNKRIFDKNYKSLFFEGDNYDQDILNELTSSNKVLISIPPVSDEDLVLKNFVNQFKNNKFDWITYLSSTSVYGNKNGEWIDENSETLPTSNRGKTRLKSEKLWMNLHKQYQTPIRIFRLAGIYSLEHNVINKLKNNTARIINKKNRFFSRIHTDDIAQALINSIKQPSSGEVYNICDDFPCSNEEVTAYAANLLKVPIPQKVKLDTIKNEVLKSFYKDSKKVMNTKMKTNLKVKLNYPTYKEGLASIFDHLS
jgi:nucleoside-diphosphate-sugar epimerase